jgi:hypothetical protein
MVVLLGREEWAISLGPLIEKRMQFHALGDSAVINADGGLSAF